MNIEAYEKRHILREFLGIIRNIFILCFCNAIAVRHITAYPFWGMAIAFLLIYLAVTIVMRMLDMIVTYVATAIRNRRFRRKQDGKN